MYYWAGISLQRFNTVTSDLSFSSGFHLSTFGIWSHVLPSSVRPVLLWREWPGWPSLRASNEHILIVRVLRARRTAWLLPTSPSLPIPQSNARRLSSRRRLGPSRSIRSAHGSRAQGG